LANFTANSAAVDSRDVLITQSLLQATAGGGGSTQWTATLGSLVWTFHGVGFAGYTNGLPNTGTITSIVTPRATLTGITLSMQDLILVLAYGTPEDLSTYLFAGDDVMTGSAFADALYGYDGNDLLTAGNGADEADGGAGDDDIFGGAGNDTLRGGAGADELHGEDGDDSIEGGAGADSLTGNLGNDTLSGGDGVDTLTGNEGNDVLNGGADADIMTGGAGNDTYYFDNAGDQIIETGGGIDTIVSSLDYTLSAEFENLTLAEGAAIHGVGNSGDNIIVGNTQNNILEGGAGNDTLDGGTWSVDTLIGGVGDDLYIVRDFNPIIIETPARASIPSAI
jgi:Ca2+-binding RTX toxin-like protein